MHPHIQIWGGKGSWASPFTAWRSTGAAAALLWTGELVGGVGLAWRRGGVARGWKTGARSAAPLQQSRGTACSAALVSSRLTRTGKVWWTRRGWRVQCSRLEESRGGRGAGSAARGPAGTVARGRTDYAWRPQPDRAIWHVHAGHGPKVLRERILNFFLSFSANNTQSSQNFKKN